jgi:hypothetical protein
MGNFPIWIHPSCPDIKRCEIQKYLRGIRWKEGTVHATPGYFDIELVNGVRAEMTASRKVALFKFSFANGTVTSDMVMSQTGADLPGTDGPRAIYIDQATGRFTAVSIQYSDSVFESNS